MRKDDKSILPTGNPNKGGLYNVPNKTESAQKISNLLEGSNQLFVESITRPRTDIYNPEKLVNSTNDYFNY